MQLRWWIVWGWEVIAQNQKYAVSCGPQTSDVTNGARCYFNPIVMPRADPDEVLNTIPSAISSTAPSLQPTLPYDIIESPKILQDTNVIETSSHKKKRKRLGKKRKRGKKHRKRKKKRNSMKGKGKRKNKRKSKSKKGKTSKNPQVISYPVTFVPFPEVIPSEPQAPSVQPNQPVQNSQLTINESKKPNYEIQQPPSYSTTPIERPLSGVTYSALLPGSCKSKEQVTSDMKLLATFTSNIRLYGADCDQLSMILEAIDNNNLDIKVLMGVWTRDGPERRDKEVQGVINMLVQHPNWRQLLTGITVGNEEVFNGRPVGDVVSDVEFTKAKLRSANIDVPVSTVEVGHVWTNELALCSHFIYANLYSFFSPSQGTPDMLAAASDVLNQVDTLRDRLGTSKSIIISETGWPSEGSTSAPHYSEPTPDSQAAFLKGLECQASRRHIPYYVMEAFDANWKQGEPIEQHFGLFTNQNQPKVNMIRSLSQCPA